MQNTNDMITELSGAELDAVAAGTYSFTSYKQFAAFNTAAQVAVNNQANLAGINFLSAQGGSQSNNNNAGNQAG